ncbi:hypothetical protein RJ641_011079, partial [Dillenia turbinata]
HSRSSFCSLTGSALSIIDALKRVPHFSHTQVTIHTIAKILAKAQRDEEMLLIRGSLLMLLVLALWIECDGHLESVVRVWDEWRGLMGKQPVY